MRLVVLVAARAAAVVAPPDLRIAVQGEARKAGGEKAGKQLSKGKDRANASAERPNTGGETKGKARADEVKRLNIMSLGVV